MEYTYCLRRSIVDDCRDLRAEFLVVRLDEKGFSNNVADVIVHFHPGHSTEERKLILDGYDWAVKMLRASMSSAEPAPTSLHPEKRPS